MNLFEFLKTSPPPRYKQKEFAKLANVSEPTIINILKGQDYSLSTAYKIVLASKGKVTFEELAKAVKPKEKS